MYIEPDSKIYVLRRVPLDNTYEHTIYFEDVNSQRTYFEKKAKFKFEKQSYQRVQRGYIRIARRAEDLFDCNYVMFQNTAFGDKWFYAFIKSVEYINNNVSQIEFEIDVLQTWLINQDWELEICFVEREHTYSDDLFEHIVPENLDAGEDYIVREGGLIEPELQTRIVLLTSCDENKNAPKIEVKENFLIGLQQTMRNAQSLSDMKEMGELIEHYINLGEDYIVGLYIAPWGDDFREIPMPITDINGYVPKNKKLFTSPYNILVVSNNAGQTATYKYENWNEAKTSHTAIFEQRSTTYPNPATAYYPRAYRGLSVDVDSALTLANFPQCAFAGDAFKAWFAQNKATIANSLISTVLGSIAVAGLSVANPALGAISAAGLTGAQYAAGKSANISLMHGAMGVTSLLAKMNDLKNTPPQIHGQVNTETLNAVNGLIHFRFMQMQIKPEYAEIIDDYFTRYGYACHKNKLPNVNARTHWTYTKTVGCTIKGSIPCDDMNRICRIFDNGITWWKDGEEIGNYNLDNAPTL